MNVLYIDSWSINVKKVFVIFCLLFFVFLFTGCQKNELNKNFTYVSDTSLNSTAYELLKKYDGVVAVCNYTNGKLICCASSVRKENTISDFDNPDNKFLYGQYTPGSIMKIATTIATIENLENYNSLEYVCEGKSDYLSGNIVCPYSHGNLNLEEAFGHSCNCFYGKLGLSIGRTKMLKSLNEIGFNKSLRYYGLKISESLFEPSDDASDLAWSSVGQASSYINPAHFLGLISTIANNGVCPVDGMDISVSPDTCEKIKELMSNNVETYYGKDRFNGFDIAGKTGTAEVAGRKSSSVFVSFSLDPSFPYATFVLVEEGGAGTGTAMNITNDMLRAIAKDVRYGSK